MNFAVLRITHFSSGLIIYSNEMDPKQEYEVATRGICSVGNSCYFAASLQVIFSAPTLKREIQRNSSPKTKRIKGGLANECKVPILSTTMQGVLNGLFNGKDVALDS